MVHSAILKPQPRNQSKPGRPRPTVGVPGVSFVLSPPTSSISMLPRYFAAPTRVVSQLVICVSRARRIVGIYCHVISLMLVAAVSGFEYSQLRFMYSSANTSMLSWLTSMFKPTPIMMSVILSPLGVAIGPGGVGLYVSEYSDEANSATGTMVTLSFQS